jgi:hypothetical protein
MFGGLQMTAEEGTAYCKRKVNFVREQLDQIGQVRGPGSHAFSCSFFEERIRRKVCGIHAVGRSAQL